ncbi:MAG: hypothetical protein PF444_02020 [Bacteroidales bacterium]|jgi:hypothetical protein|nr:hypothetical protein [Bacteroidales bacterium]
MTNIIFADIKAAIPAVWGNESTLSSYMPAIDNAKYRMMAYVGIDVIDTTEETISPLVKSVMIKDAFAASASTLTMYHDGKSFVMGESDSEERVTVEDLNLFIKGLRAQFFTEMNALLMALESNTSLRAKWKLTPSYSFIEGGIIPELTTLMSLTKIPPLNPKYSNVLPTRMDFAREWRPLLVRNQYKLRQYFGRDVITEMLKDEFEELRYQLRMIMIEMTFGDERESFILRKDLMREMAENIETYAFITNTAVYARYVAAAASRRVNSSDSKIYVSR